MVIFNEDDNDLVELEKKELEILKKEMQLCELSNHALSIKTLKRLAYLEAKYENN